MSEPGNTSAEVVLRKFDELYKKYKFMEVNILAKRNRSEIYNKPISSEYVIICPTG